MFHVDRSFWLFCGQLCNLKFANGALEKLTIGASEAFKAGWHSVVDDHGLLSPDYRPNTARQVGGNGKMQILAPMKSGKSLAMTDVELILDNIERIWRRRKYLLGCQAQNCISHRNL
jgi:hypothetical protein